MQPMASMTAADRARKAASDARINDLLDIACDSDDTILVCDDDRQHGLITERSLMRSIKGQELN